ncbi:MAG: lipoate--protein ligase family protein [Candidatus Micrarchaeota archaeon]|nr:lipoate--protein ligase family protein [Candidatus Micrarchaeota archaeon]
MIVHSLYKAPKGLIRIEADLDSGVLASVRITGDFFMVPEESISALERHLEGVRLDQGSVSKAIDDFYSSGVETPMLGRDDMVKAVMGVSSGS